MTDPTRPLAIAGDAVASLAARHGSRITRRGDGDMYPLADALSVDLGRPDTAASVAQRATVRASPGVPPCGGRTHTRSMTAHIPRTDQQRGELASSLGVQRCTPMIGSASSEALPG
jgi:hypothetical protein